jgi:hypothetical protein
VQHLSLTPWGNSARDRQAALSLVLTLLPFAAPLYLQGMSARWDAESTVR